MQVEKCEFFEGCIVNPKDCVSCRRSFYCVTQNKWVDEHCDYKLCTERYNVAI